MLIFALSIMALGPLAFLFEDDGDGDADSLDEDPSQSTVPPNGNGSIDILNDVFALGYNNIEVPENVLIGNGDQSTISGESSSEIIVGTDGDDQIFGFGQENVAENDIGAGDIILAGAGDDIAVGSTSEDLILGGEGDDTLIGGEGSDSLYGGEGNDFLNGVHSHWDGLQDIDQADLLYGGDGDDTIVAGNNDIVTGGDGADIFVLAGNSSVVSDFDIMSDQLLIELPPGTSQDQIENLRGTLRLEESELGSMTTVSVYLGANSIPIAFIEGVSAENLSPEMFHFFVSE